MDNEKNGETKILAVEDDSFEMNITVNSIGNEVLEDSKTLKEIVDYAMSKGFLRFVGTAGEYNDKQELVFIFSKEDYFDKDDGLVRNFEASAKIDKMIAENKKQKR